MEYLSLGINSIYMDLFNLELHSDYQTIRI